MEKMAPAGPLSTADALKHAIVTQLPDATVEVVSSGGGHFSLTVRSPAFREYSTLERHKMVYAAIAPLLAGDSAPVHAIDVLRTMVE